MRLRTFVCTLAWVAVAFVADVRADDVLRERGTQLVITTAIVAADGTTIFVTGRNFGSSPFVMLGELSVEGVTVNEGGTALTGIMPAVPPGTYQLHVWRGSGANQQAWISVAVIGPGLQGPPGADGKDGKDGLDGKDGVNGTNGNDGVDGKDGKDGIGFKNVVANWVSWSGSPMEVEDGGALFSVTADFPAAGSAYVLASGTCFGEPGSNLRFLLDTKNTVDWMDFGVATANAITDANDGQASFAVARAFDVAQGSQTFYVNMMMGSGPAGGPFEFDCNATATVFFSANLLP